MQTKKMSLANIKGKLSRTEMKNIMAGSGGSGMQCVCNNGNDAGMVSCDTCERYCSTDHSYGGQKSCS